jgi:hypothetical protein
MRVIRLVLALSLALPALAAAQGAPPRSPQTAAAQRCGPRYGAGWSGSSCETPIATACSGHGLMAAGVCSCAPGWTGASCEASVAALSCSGHGQMIASRCFCTTYWMGSNCEMRGFTAGGALVGR